MSTIHDNVDLVLTAPLSEVYQPNARKRGQLIELPEPFDDAAKFVVRTALVRVQGFDRAKRVILRTPTAVARLCRHMVRYDQEHLVTIAVDVGLSVLAIHEVGIGQRSQTSVAIGDVSKLPLLCGASGVFMVHNHPSGRPEPSSHDIDMYKELKRVLTCQGVDLFDSIVVAREGYYAISEGGPSSWPDWIKDELEV